MPRTGEFIFQRFQRGLFPSVADTRITFSSISLFVAGTTTVAEVVCSALRIMRRRRSDDLAPRFFPALSKHAAVQSAAKQKLLLRSFQLRRFFVPTSSLIAEANCSFHGDFYGIPCRDGLRVNVSRLITGVRCVRVGAKL